MLEHTHDRTSWMTHYGKLVVLMARPQKTTQKSYREPVKISERKFKTKAEAEIVAKQYNEGVLV